MSDVIHCQNEEYGAKPDIWNPKIDSREGRRPKKLVRDPRARRRNHIQPGSRGLNGKRQKRPGSGPDQIHPHY